MKNLKISALLATFLTALVSIPAISETTFEDVKKELSETMSTMSSYTVDQKDDFVAGAKNVMDKVDAQMDQLANKMEEEWDSMSEVSRKKRSEAMRKLRRQRNELSEWYGGVKQSTAEGWADTKKGFNQAYETISESFSTTGTEQ